uniref:RBR-type E3 ubiquitin transferase n=1 Tax=Nicotiana tabacum TaxID=4097 RepID=A0A1S4A2E9_TOBAC|nr:PREDICTED: probable E3 ubiquitin-protein ligase ARI7 [Nicotiana tabacum]XP_016470863.1 PREDICTED: probable E3 ubiquitin-protein ligase ARI7 [Nicotiana tabacum]
MESEDDMHDANDMESVDEDFYSDGDGYGGAALDSDGDDADYDFMGNESDDSNDQAVNRSQKNYTVLKEEDIRQRQEDDITTISALLSLQREAACILLRRYNWSVNKVHEEWFADEERVRKSVGLLERPVIHLSKVKEVACGICFDNFPPDGIRSLKCGHPFCTTCWKAYITTSINDGPGCLTLRCPDPSCDAAIGQNMIDTLASGEDKDKYYRYLLRSYIEDNRKVGI